MTRKPATVVSQPPPAHEPQLVPPVGLSSNGQSHAAPHPEREHGSRIRSIASWAVFFGLAAAAWFTQSAWRPWVKDWLPGGGAAAGRPAARPIPVRTAVAQVRDMDLYLNGLGTVTAFGTVTIRSRVDGELIDVAFTEGQLVTEGDLLAEVDPRPYEVQLQQAQGQLARDEATLTLAKATLARTQALLRSRVSTAQEIEQQTATVQQAEAAIQTDKAMVANATLQLTYCRIIAPISGRIGLRMVDEGNIVRANDATGMAVITQLKPISLVFTIPQDDIPRVQKTMSEGKPLVVEAWDRDFRTKIATGRLAAIDNQVDSLTGTLRLKAEFENDDGVLFPNQFVNVRLLVETRRDSVVVPSAAVQRGPNGDHVYVVLPDETVDLRPVERGPTEGADTAIASGLGAGDVVVTEGIDKLQKGSKVSTREKEEKDGKKPSAADPKGAIPAGDRKDSR